ncbi:MAG TPA: hypothetical protein VGD83_01415 [Streptosporangiaceae bacterium]
MSRGPASRIRVGLALACAGLTADCGTQAATVAVTRPPAVTASLSTSLTTAQGTWAIAVMGGSAASHNNFWQLFVRRANSGRWSLATPEGVADNGGLVAAGGNGSLVVGFRPSQELAFSPLATSTDAGLNWTPGLLDAALADTPGAIAVGPSGRTLALLQDGTIEAAPTADDAAAGQWVPLATLKALAASAPGRSCGLKGMTAVSFGPDQNPIAAGSCVRPGAAGVFTDAGGTWRSAGLTLPTGGPGMGTVRVLGLAAIPGGNVALLAAGDSLLAAWWNGTRWTVSAPVTADGVRALGFGPGGSAWLLLDSERAETITRAAGSTWRALPPVPAGTKVLAPAGTGRLAPGTGGSYDALAVAGSRLTVWRLARGAWGKVQQITVPVQYSSSG